MVSNSLGIHLGSSECIACVYVDGKPNFIPSRDGTSSYEYSFPNYVAFTDAGSVLVGEVAKRRFVSHPEDVVSGIRNEIGRNIKKEYYGKLYSPTEILAFILGKIKKDAESFLNNSTDDAVIAVPAYFDDNQRNAIKDAAMLTGLNVELIAEPIAACLAFGNSKKNQNILVFDLGNGTLDVTVLKYDSEIFEVKATSGDTNLGQTDFDIILTDFFIKEFEKQHGVKLNLNYKLRNRLIEAAKSVRNDLISVFKTNIYLPFMGMDYLGNPLDLDVNINRNQFDDLVRPIVNRCGKPIQTALDDAGLTKNDINKLILAGNATRMPVVRNFVENFIGIASEDGIDPVTCIAQGAALKGVVVCDEIEPINNKEILENQINELENIVYLSKKYIYEPEFEDKLNDLEMAEIKNLISNLKNHLI